MMIVYIAVIVCLLVLSLCAVFNYRSPSNFKGEYLNSVAIVIPFRNEEKRLNLLLNSLLNFKDYAIQVVLVNDHSTDKSLERITEFVDNHNLNFVQLVNAPNDVRGKKSAQFFGVQQVEADWIYFADADTELSTKFLEYIYSIPSNSSQKFIQGFPIFHSPKPSFLFHVLNLEFLTLVGLGFIARFYRFPILANGAIMAMPRDIYLKADLKNDFASGDDVFALRAIRQKYGLNSIRFTPIVVKTAAPHSLSESIQQKKRWISKWSWIDYLAGTIALAILVAGPILAAFNTENSLLLIAGLPLALLIVILSLMSLTKNYKSLLYLPLVIFILPVYLALVCYWVQKSTRSWKNRPI